MSDEETTELTERVAGYVEHMLALVSSHPSHDAQALSERSAEIRSAVLALCQTAQHGASPRPAGAAIWLPQYGHRMLPGLVFPEHSSGGVGMRLFVTAADIEEPDVARVNLGIEGALHLSGELSECARQAAVLSERERQARLGNGDSP